MIQAALPAIRQRYRLCCNASMIQLLTFVVTSHILQAKRDTSSQAETAKLQKRGDKVKSEWTLDPFPSVISEWIRSSDYLRLATTKIFEPESALNLFVF